MSAKSKIKKSQKGRHMTSHEKARLVLQDRRLISTTEIMPEALPKDPLDETKSHQTFSASKVSESQKPSLVHEVFVANKEEEIVPQENGITHEELPQTIAEYKEKWYGPNSGNISFKELQSQSLSTKERK